MHARTCTHTSEPNVLYSKYANLQYANTREHMGLIGSAVTKQHLHKHTHANEFYRGSVACGGGLSSPAHILFPDQTRARLFREAARSLIKDHTVPKK